MFFLVVQNKFIVFVVGLGQSEIWRVQDKDKDKEKTTTKINKGKDQRQKKKTNHIIQKIITHHKFKKIKVIHLRLLLTHNAKLNKLVANPCDARDNSIIIIYI